MSGKTFSKFLAAAIALAAFSFVSNAQTCSSYAPYSIYGVGNMHLQGTSYNRTMGGVGIAARDSKFLNPLNPASVTARDTLAFMADFSLYESNSIFKQGDMKSAVNLFDVGDLIMSFPIWKGSAMMVGLMPYSSTGYGYGMIYEDQDLIGRTGDIAYTAEGQGGLNMGFASFGATFFKRLSLGVEGIYYFGKNEKTYTETFSDESYNGATNGFNMSLHGMTAKFGVQYEQPIGESKIGVGATYTMGTTLNGYVEGYRYSTGTAATDTLYHKTDTLSYRTGSDRIRLASEIGVGISYRFSNKFMCEFDYTRSDWTGTSLDSEDGFAGNLVPASGKSIFAGTLSESYRFGMEYVPNRNDARYYLKRVSYRAGAYYRNEYYTVDGYGVNSKGITLGATFPLIRVRSGVSVGMELGQRGSLQNNLIRENYINFTFGVNLLDVWFMKPHYE